MCDKRVFGYSTLLFIEVTNLFLSIDRLRSVHFSLAGFNRFLSSSRFILVAVLLQESTVFFSKIQSGFCIYEFSTMSPLFQAIFR